MTTVSNYLHNTSRPPGSLLSTRSRPQVPFYCVCVGDRPFQRSRIQWWFFSKLETFENVPINYLSRKGKWSLGQFLRIKSPRRNKRSKSFRREYPGSSSPIKIFSFYVRRGKGQKIIDVGILDSFGEITESGKVVLFFAYGTVEMGYILRKYPFHQRNFLQ